MSDDEHGAAPTDWSVRIQRLRAQRGDSLRTLAAVLGVTSSSLHAIEHGRIRRPHTLLRTAIAELEADTFRPLTAPSTTPRQHWSIHCHDGLWFGTVTDFCGETIVNFAVGVGSTQALALSAAGQARAAIQRLRRDDAAA